MLPVFGAVGGIDDQQELIGLKAVQVRIIHGPAGGAGDDRVLGRQLVERGGVVREAMLKEGQCAPAANYKSPHVRHIEQARTLARSQVFSHDASWVLDGHVPAAEVDHLRAQRDVPGVQGRVMKFAHRTILGDRRVAASFPGRLSIWPDLR